MFLKESYISANELAKLMGIHIANVSNFSKIINEQEKIGVVKRMNSTTFFNMNNNLIPNTFREGFEKYKDQITDVSDKLPIHYIFSEYNINKKELEKMDICTGFVDIAGKEFAVFEREFVNKVKRHITYVLDPEDFADCNKRGLLKGYVKVNKKKYLVWY